MPTSLHTLSLLAGLGAGLFLAAAVAWLLARARRAAAVNERELQRAAAGVETQALRREQDELRARLATADAQLEDLRARGERLLDERGALLSRSERAMALEQELREARLRCEQAERRATESAARLDEQQRASTVQIERMREQFQNLANDILEEKSRRFSEQNSTQIGLLLTPLREQLGDFRRAVHDAYEKESNQRIALQTRIDDLVRLNQTLGQEAQSLSRALSADNRTQGYWGELKLERLLESAGLEKGREYLTQESFRDDEGDRYRPDAVLRLPEGRDLVIDAKVALLDYQRACEATADDERERCFVRHVAALRAHVRALGEKDYSRLEGIGSPDLVLMFVPVEAAFLEALRRDPGLYEDAFQRKIILVGPSNLLASLRLVAQIWRTEQQNHNARAIADRAATLYDKFVGFVNDLDKVRAQFATAHSTLDGAYAKLSTGKGNLIRQAQMLRELGVAPSKRLPAALTGGDDEYPLPGAAPDTIAIAPEDEPIT